MPKIVNHDKQREKIAEATWRIIRRDGMEQASVRNIAKEAKVSVGSMRHYFSSQSELYAYSMELVSERVKERIQNITFNGPPLEDMIKLLKELLPIDEDTKLEMEVWFVFVAKSLVDPTLHELSQRVYAELRMGMHHVIQSLVELDMVHSNINVDLEVERLYAVIDGLAIHSIMHPDKLPPSLLENLVTHHLQSLCK